jgi:hypothetical protein
MRTHRRPDFPCSPGRRQQSGIALILAIMVLFVLSSLAAAILFTVQTQSWTASNYRLDTQSRFLAETAAQGAASWFEAVYQPSSVTYSSSPAGVTWNGAPVVLAAIDGQSSNYPDGATVSSFYNAMHDQMVNAPGFRGYWAASATLLNWQPVPMPFGLPTQPMETWQVVAQGHVFNPQGTTTVEQIVTLSQFLQPLLSFAAFATSPACGAVSLLGGSITDSFDSSRGTYQQTHALLGGNLGSFGNVSIGDHSTVNGSIEVPEPTLGSCPGNGVTLGPGATVTGAQSGGALAPFLPLKTMATLPVVPPFQAATGKLVVNKDQKLTPGTYGDIQVQGTAQLTFAPGIYYINSLTVSGNASIAIASASGGSGAVILYVAGTGQTTPVSLTGNSLTNTTGIPANFQILYGGSGTIQIAGGSAAFGVVYAPKAAVQMAGGSDWYGAIISSTFSEKGNPTALHYDRSLSQQFLVPGPFQVVGVSRAKF